MARIKIKTYKVVFDAISHPGGAIYKRDTPIVDEKRLAGVNIDELIELGAIRYHGMIEIEDDSEPTGADTGNGEAGKTETTGEKSSGKGNGRGKGKGKGTAKKSTTKRGQKAEKAETDKTETAGDSDGSDGSTDSNASTGDNQPVA